MALTREWDNRIRLWIDELPRHYFEPLGEVEFEGCPTMERLSLEDAMRLPYAPMPPGTAWGAKWEYCWLRSRVVLPEAARGRRIVLMANPGNDGLVFVDGRAAGASDREHQELTLSMSGVPGALYDIAAEFYAGHGAIEESVGPVPPGRVPIPEPGSKLRVVAESGFGAWDDAAFLLWVDAETLYRLRNALPGSSLRVSEIDDGLRDFTRIVDFEQGPEGRRRSFAAGRERLKPLLARANGPTAPTFQVFGQSHLDLAWQWPREETLRKSARTMSTQLALLEEYPEYKYFFCQAPLYLMLKESYPEIYDRVLANVASGRILAEGGMWLEPDTNIPMGESLVRQFIFGRRFFEEELGKATRLLWLPDTFGFSAALPQIMKSCGVDYFATKKLIDDYNDSDPFPYTTFMWQGLDGSRVLSHVYRKCNSSIDPATFAKRWETDRIQKDGISLYLFPFGYGDGGGGPSRVMLEAARRLVDLEGSPKARMGGPLEFFEEIERNGEPGNSYVGELYFTEHRGTYTSQARTKRANRKAELAMREAELWGTLASALGDFEYPRAAIDASWKRLLFNHFHDIVTGTSIRRVHEEAEAELGEVRACAEGVADSARRSFGATSAETRTDVAPRAPREGAETRALRAFNSLSWTRRELVALPPGLSSAFAADGSELPVQASGGTAYAELALPSCGWTTAYLAHGVEGAGRGTDGPGGEAIAIAGADGRSLENGLIRVALDERGALSSVFDKAGGRELAAEPCNDFRMYRDVTTNYDAWNIDSMYESVPVALEGHASIGVVASGPLFAVLRVERALAGSDLVQEIWLRRGSARVEFRTRIEWREDHKLLKVAFPVTIRAEEAISEIQFGHVRRPTHRNRRHDADRYEVCQQRWTALAESRRGFAVLNDCKYGVSVSGSCISLTLLKSAFVPDMAADRGSQEFVYAIYPWNGSFAESGLVREGYALNCPPTTSTPRSGGAPERSFFAIDDPAIVLETVKPAEDGSGDAVLRLYESLGSAARCAIDISLPIALALETDMLERGGAPLALAGKRIVLDFRPFEIKTLRLRFAGRS